MTDDIQASQPIEPTVAENATTESTVSSGSFLDSISEDLRADPSLSDIQDINGLAKSYVNAQRMLGNSVRIPGEDASVEAKQEFYSKLTNVPGVVKMPDPNNQQEIDSFYNMLGRPESSEGYKLSIGEDIPIDQNAQNEFFQLAHGLGLTQTQVDALAQYELQRASSINESYEHSRTNAEQVLKEQWGPDFNNRLEGAKAALQVYANKYPEAVEELVNSPAGNNPVVLSLLAELSPILQEKGAIQGAGRIQYGMSAEEARDQISEIRMNKAHPYNNSSDPNHSAAAEKVKKLYEIAYSE